MSGTAHGAPDEMQDEWPDESLPIRTSSNAFPLPGYTRRVVQKTVLVARAPLMDALATIVQQHGTLYAWAAAQPQPRALRGRAPVYVADVPKTDVTMVVRHAWHGGLLAPLTRDLYLHPTRAPLELIRTIMLRQMGIAVPELVAYALYPVMPAVSRVDVATRFVPDAHDLGAVLAAQAPALVRSDAMTAVEALLVQLAAHAIEHPDLNVKNILLRRDGDHDGQRGTVRASVIDVDVVNWKPGQRPAVTMLANVARLARSMRKWRRRFGVDLPDAELNDLVARFMAAAPASLAPVAAHSDSSRRGTPRVFE